MEEIAYKYLFDDAEQVAQEYWKIQKELGKKCREALTAFVKAMDNSYPIYDILEEMDEENVDFPTVLFEDRHSFTVWSVVKSIYINDKGKVLLDLEDCDGYELDYCTTDEVCLLFHTVNTIEILRFLKSNKNLCKEATLGREGELHLTTDEVHHIYIDSEGDKVEVPIKTVRYKADGKNTVTVVTEMDDEFELEVLPLSTLQDLWNILFRQLYEVSFEENSSV